MCEQARHLTPDRLSRLPPPLPLDVADTAKEISRGMGSRLGAGRGQSSEPMHTEDPPASERLTGLHAADVLKDRLLDRFTDT
jgi:hypothetical protein